MGLNYCVSKLSSFSIDENFRLDARFALFSQIDFVTYWQSSDLYLLKDILKPVSSPIYKKGALNDEFCLIDLANVGHKVNTLQNLEMVNEIGSDKHFIKDGDLIIPKIEPKKGNFFLNLEHKEFLGSTELIEYKIDIEKYNPVFLYYLLVSEKILKLLSYLESGKTHKRVNTDTLLRQIKIPKIDICKQAMVAQEIGIIEKEITQLKDSKTPTLDIINQVFDETFGFNWNIVENLQKEKIHIARFSDFANDELKFDLSLKTRFIFNEYVKNPYDIEWVSLAKIVDIKGGKRLPKGENVIDEETAFKYIRVEDLGKDGIFDFDNIKYISEENHLIIKNYIAKENDILLTIVGATIGKCGIVPIELDGENITENFARLIINDKEKYLPEYLNYCLMSKLSQIQFDEYTGKSSQGKLAIFRIAKVVIPNLDVNKQSEIVQKIKFQLGKQQEIDKQIEEKQRQIEQLIEKAIFE